MEIKARYLNDDFIINFEEKIMAGTLLAFLIQKWGLKVPIINEYGNPIALQMWSTSYSLDLNKSIKEQSRAINLNYGIGVAQTVNCDIDEFNLTIKKYKEALDSASISLSKVDNKYSDFRNELRKDADHFVQKIKDRDLAMFINEAYSENDFEKIKADFDYNGLFTRKIMKSKYFMDDKSCDEEQLWAILGIDQLTFKEDPSDIYITMLFGKALENGINKFTIDKSGKADLPFEQTNELYALAAPNYSVKLVNQGIEVEKEIEFLRNSLEKRLSLFNSLLEKVGRTDRWFILGNGSCLLTTESQYRNLLSANLLPPDLNYFNPWEY